MAEVRDNFILFYSVGLFFFISHDSFFIIPKDPQKGLILQLQLRKKGGALFIFLLFLPLLPPTSYSPSAEDYKLIGDLSLLGFPLDSPTTLVRNAFY